MSYKKLLLAAAALMVGSVAHAQSAGSNVISLGWFHIMPTGQADPLTIDRIGPVATSTPQPNTGAKIESTDTAGIAFEHYFTDNIGVEASLGIPPKHDVSGKRGYEKFGKLGEVRQWSPALLVKWHFFEATTKFRPYVGLGVNYTWFTGETITNQDFVRQNFGPNASMSASASSSWNPVFNVGANYAITEKWSIGLSVSYVPMSSTATFTTTNSAIAGQTIVSHTKIKINPVATYLNVAYKF